MCTTNVHINYDFILSKSLNSPNLYINWANMWYPDYQNKKLNLCMLNSFKGFHLCIKWPIMWYLDNQLRKKLNLCMLLQADKNILCKNQTRIQNLIMNNYIYLQDSSPRNWPRQSAIAEGFAEANSVFTVVISAKILSRWLFPSKIYIQFTIFNTYLSTKLSFTKKRYHLHVLEKCLYVLQEVRSIIYFR